MSRELQVLTDVSRKLATIKTVSEAKDLRDKAEAVRVYAKSARLGLKTQNDAAYVKLLCERRAGEILVGMDLKRGKPKKEMSRDGTLSRLGITRNQSARWQALAQWPEKELVRVRAICEDEDEELTISLIVAYLREYADQHQEKTSKNKNGKKTKSRAAEAEQETEQTEERETDESDETEEQAAEDTEPTRRDRERLLTLYREAAVMCDGSPFWGGMGRTLRKWIDQLEEGE